jgi:hypothetical protein
LEELENYEEIIRDGSQVRYLKIKRIPLRFSIFDKKEVIMVFPQKANTPHAIEALWLRIPSLAMILQTHFEELWRISKPLLPVLQEIKKEKAESKKRRRQFP